MSIATGASPIQPEPQLAGQTVVVIGGSAGIGLETARLPRAEGAKLVLAARNPERLQYVASSLAALHSVAFDATDFERLAQFFGELPSTIDHVLLTGPGPYYAALAEFDFEKARRDVEAHLFLPLQVARHAANKVRPGGTLLFMGGTGGRRTAKGFALISALSRDAGHDKKSGARTRACSRQPHRRRVCRHTIVGVARNCAPLCQSAAWSARTTSTAASSSSRGEPVPDATVIQNRRTMMPSLYRDCVMARRQGKHTTLSEAPIEAAAHQID